MNLRTCIKDINSVCRGHTTVLLFVDDAKLYSRCNIGPLYITWSGWNCHLLVRILPQWTKAFAQRCPVRCRAPFYMKFHRYRSSGRSSSSYTLYRFTRNCEATPAASSSLCRRNSDQRVPLSVGSASSC
jgi:hypothetical protein